MRALTITQPWATLIAIGAKHYETRDWETGYRGPLAIHAAKGWKREDKEICSEDPFKSCLAKAGFFNPDDLPRGMIVAVSQLHSCCLMADEQCFQYLLGTTVHEHCFGNFSTGRIAWYLSKIQRLENPIDCKGALGLWDVPHHIELAIYNQLGRTS